jgi:hypothetical protein
MSRFAQYPLKYAVGYVGDCAVCVGRIWMGAAYHDGGGAEIAHQECVTCPEHGVQKDDAGVCPQSCEGVACG